MSYLRHHGIAVTSWNKEAIQSAHTKALEIFDATTVSAVLGSYVNGYTSFFIAPDGSNEYWDESNEGDDRRDTFIEHLKTYSYEDGSTPLSWAEVQYGDENGIQKVLRASKVK